MKFSKKFLSFTLKKSQWKIEFLTIFLPFSRVPEAVGEFFAYEFFPFCGLGGGGNFAGRCGIQAGWGGEFPPPRVNVWPEP